MSDIGAKLSISAAPGGFDLSGEIDAHTAPDLEQRLTEHLAAEDSTRLGLSGVTFMDSSGLSVLVSTTETCRERGGDLLLVAPSPAVVRILHASGLADHFTTQDS